MLQGLYLVADKICNKISLEWNGIDAILIWFHDETVALDEISAKFARAQVEFRVDFRCLLELFCYCYFFCLQI